jgi:lysophospholipase L1-like esterase
LNTFACQIEKLKRLMAGVDLDPGESQVYNGTSPDVILIQGGHNDNPDATIDNYFVQYEKQVSGVYIKQKDGKPTELGTCYIKTPISEIDQTTFAGAYRYLVDELMQLFPSAQIYATTPANLGYWNGSVAQKRYTTSEQIRMVLNLCAVECIDWNRVANISVVRDYPSGSGTSDDPYVWAQGNGEAWADTSDAMHPNSIGARKLGQLTAQKIVDGFFSFNV